MTDSTLYFKYYVVPPHLKNEAKVLRCQKKCIASVCKLKYSIIRILSFKNLILLLFTSITAHVKNSVGDSTSILAISHETCL